MNQVQQELVDATLRINERAKGLLKASTALVDQATQLDEDIRSLATVTEMIVDLMPEPPRPEASKLLSVPYLSQLDTPDADYAPGDCGPGCAAMLLNYLGHNVTIDDVSAQTGLQPGYHFTNSTHMIKAAYHWGVNLYWRKGLTLDDLKVEIDSGKPVIVLVHYPRIPREKKYDRNYKYDHFVLLIGYGPDCFYYHDPYFPDQRGKCIKLDEVIFYQV